MTTNAHDPIAQQFADMRARVSGMGQNVRATVIETIPLIKDASTIIVETFDQADDNGKGRSVIKYHGFIQAIVRGQTVQLYIPPAAMEKLYDQRDACRVKRRRSNGKAAGQRAQAEGKGIFAKEDADGESR